MSSSVVWLDGTPSAKRDEGISLPAKLNNSTALPAGRWVVEDIAPAVCRLFGDLSFSRSDSSFALHDENCGGARATLLPRRDGVKSSANEGSGGRWLRSASLGSSAGTSMDATNHRPRELKRRF